ncbi:MAG: YcgN family cysteine cluster protein [Methylocapsa sp.]|nr:YcgN family cysteine cluster protein [Methylocapsa sp.]
MAKTPRARSTTTLALPSGLTPFWKQKTLEELTHEEWESLCDGCGRCCLVKLEDEHTGKVYFTDIGCKLFDAGNCRCSDYARRQRRVRDCIRLTAAKVRVLGWLPSTCAYRLVAEGRDLFWWHPLVSGSKESVHEAGVSVKGRVIASEKEVEPADYPRHIVAWPAKRPAACRKGPAASGDASKNNS